MTDDLNYVAQNADRYHEVTRELQAIRRNESPRSTVVPGEGTINHYSWLAAERRELAELQEELESVVTIQGTVEYDS